MLDESDPDDPGRSEAFRRGLEDVTGDLEVVLGRRAVDARREIELPVLTTSSVAVFDYLPRDWP